MNRSFVIIMVPVLLVTLGYLAVFTHLGFKPGYPRLFITVTLFFGLIWWLGSRAARKSKTREP